MASRRGYVAASEIAGLVSGFSAGVTDEQISEAEEIIDAYVGYQEKFIDIYYRGQCTVPGTTASKIIDNTGGNQLFRIDNYFIGCELECIGGTGIGQRGIIASSNRLEQSVTLAAPFATAMDTTSEWKIYQLGKFPRSKDVIVRRDSSVYYKSIPEAVKRATAYQVEFMLTQGQSYFASDETNMSSETVGNYTYIRGDRAAGAPSSLVSMISPRARAVLKGIKNSTGRISTGDRPSNQVQTFFP